MQEGEGGEAYGPSSLGTFLKEEFDMLEAKLQEAKSEIEELKATLEEKAKETEPENGPPEGCTRLHAWITGTARGVLLGKSFYLKLEIQILLHF